MSHRLRQALGLLVLCLTVAAQAQVYRWVDKDGKVHYSDKAPKDVRAEGLAVQSRPTDAAAAEQELAELRARSAAADATAVEREQTAAQQAEMAAFRARRCERARAEVALFNTVTRAFTIDAKGERVYETDAQLDARRAAAQRAVAAECG